MRFTKFLHLKNQALLLIAGKYASSPLYFRYNFFMGEKNPVIFKN